MEIGEHTSNRNRDVNPIQTQERAVAGKVTQGTELASKTTVVGEKVSEIQSNTIEVLRHLQFASLECDVRLLHSAT